MPLFWFRPAGQAAGAGADEGGGEQVEQTPFVLQSPTCRLAISKSAYLSLLLLFLILSILF